LIQNETALIGKLLILLRVNVNSKLKWTNNDRILLQGKIHNYRFFLKPNDAFVPVIGHVKKWSPSISSASAYPNLFVNHQLYASERRLKADFKSIFS